MSKALVFPSQAQLVKTVQVIEAADKLDETALVMGEARQVLLDMPVLDDEQRRLMAEVDERLNDAINAIKVLDYRLEVFKEKGIL